MENWIGIGIWIVMGGLIGLVMRAVVKRPDATPGHTTLIVVLGAFAAVVGGMLGSGDLRLLRSQGPEHGRNGRSCRPGDSLHLHLPMGSEGPI